MSNGIEGSEWVKPNGHEIHEVLTSKEDPLKRLKTPIGGFIKDPPSLPPPPLHEPLSSWTIYMCPLRNFVGNKRLHTCIHFFHENKFVISYNFQPQPPQYNPPPPNVYVYHPKSRHESKIMNGNAFFKAVFKRII
jgi:hypothetical protein